MEMIMAFVLIFILPTIGIVIFGRWVINREEDEQQQNLAAALQNFSAAKPFGDARFATPAEIEQAGHIGVKGIFLGFDMKTNCTIRYAGESNVFLFGAPRSHKATDHLVPLCLEYGLPWHGDDKPENQYQPCPASMLIIDPRAQLTCVSYETRGRGGQELHVLNPYHQFDDQLGRWASSYNPLAAFDPKSITLKEDCEEYALIMVPEVTAGNEKHWADGARNLICGLLMDLVRNEPIERRSLPELRSIIAMSNGEVLAWAKFAADRGDRMIRETLLAFGDGEARNKIELEGMISHARTCTGFITSEALGPVMSGNSGLDVAAMKERPITASLIIPTEYMESGKKWARLSLCGMLKTLFRGGMGKCPVVIVIDEYHQIMQGGFAAVSRALEMGAGHGCQLVCVAHDLAELKDIHGAGWQTPLSSCGARVFVPPIREEETLEYVSRCCGETTIVDQGLSETQQHQQMRQQGNRNSDGINWTHKSRRMILPQEVAAGGEFRFIAFLEGVRHPVLGRRKRYWDIDHYKGKYGLDPNYTKGRD